MTLDLSDIDMVAFDLDGTLYEYTEANLKSHREGNAAAVLRLSNETLTFEQAYDLCAKSYVETGSSWTYPERELGLCPRTLHVIAHQGISHDHIEPLPELRAAFMDAAATGLKNIIATHSHFDFARPALNKLTIGDQIADEDIVTLEKVDETIKRQKHIDPAFFDYIIDRYRINPSKILFAEDSLPNLVQAKKSGMRTAFMHWGTHRLDTLPDYIDQQFETPVELLRSIAANRMIVQRHALIVPR